MSTTTVQYRISTQFATINPGTASCARAASRAKSSRFGTVLAADRTLGGLCDWVEAEAPRAVDLPVEGAASFKAAVIPVVLHYTTADPLA